MKLILKRFGGDPNRIRTRRLGDPAPIGPGRLPDARPFALHTEDGEVLPRQISASMTSEPGGPVTVTVVFLVDGDRVSVEGP